MTMNFPSNTSKLQREKDERVNLAEKSRIELVDLLYREEKLCKNKRFLEKLPDKGEKMLKFYNQIKEELQRRDNQDQLCGELAKLSVDESREALNRLEWTGDYKTATRNSVAEDETDPLKILATHSGTEVSKQKVVKFAPPSKTQLPDSDKMNNELPNVDIYAKDLCDRFDSNVQPSTKKKFHTHKPLIRTSIKDNVDNENTKETDSSDTSNTIADNATNKVKMLSLQESIAIQHQQNKNLKEIEMRSAMEKLRMKVKIENRSPQFDFLNYRDNENSESEDEMSNISTCDGSEQDED